MTWTYQQKEFTEEQIGDYVGFVYLITNTTNNKKYVGQKVFWNKTVKKPLKGRVNKRRGKKPSDWMEYWGSNDQLKADVVNDGHHLYTREILRLCKSKGELNYWESYEIFIRHAIVLDEYYNNWVKCRVNQSQLKAISI